MDIRSKAAIESCAIPITDPATGAPMLNEKNEVCSITYYGPASTAYAAAKSADNKRMVNRVRTKGNNETTPEEDAAAVADFLTSVTISINGFDYNGQTEGEDTFRALYLDRGIGFIPEQMNRKVADWGNFSKASPAS